MPFGGSSQPLARYRRQQPGYHMDNNQDRE